MTHGTEAQRFAGQRLGAVAIIRRGRRISGWRGWRDGAEELPTAGQLVAAMAGTEEAVIPNPVEPGRQHVQEKAANEFRGGERHGFLGLRGVGPVVLVGEADLVILDVEQPVIGDRHAVRVSPDVVDDLLWPRERSLRVDDPVGLPHGSERPQPGWPMPQRLQRADETERAPVIGGLEVLEEQAMVRRVSAVARKRMP
jgi:hypothetical protein